MAASTTDAQLLRNVRAFAKALSDVHPVPISIPGTRPLLVGRPLDAALVQPVRYDEDFPKLRRKHEYRFLLKEGPLDLSVQLFANTRGHWRLFAFRKRRSIFSLNLTLAHKDRDPVLSLQQRLKLSNFDMSPEKRLRVATQIADQLRGFGLNVKDRDIIFPDFDTRSGKFTGSTAAAFIRDFVVAAVVKGHYMENKGYELPGFDDIAMPAPRRSRAKVSLETAEEAVDKEGAFDPHDKEDARERTLTSIVRRRGQPEFRKNLIKAYGGKCAVTGCDFEGALEAAHITPYRGAHTNRVTNGLLLRADIHTLFDLGYITVDARTMKVRLAAALKGTTYWSFEGKALTLPKRVDLHPSPTALTDHRRETAQ
jgi:hypothetical protein